MGSIHVRHATKHDIESLLKMPPYAKCGLDFPCSEEILLAVNNGKVLGAVSVCHRDISYVYGEWKGGFEQCLNNLVQKVSSGWISKLYVFPEYRHRGIGTRLVKEAVKSLKERDFDEVYAGIYVKNRFRNVSQHVFEKNGFAKIGSCICPLSKGHCRGTLLKKTIRSSNQRKRNEKIHKTRPT
jgi:GNAT superfamily N-acetyltransferase